MEFDGCEPPHRASLPAVGNFLEFAFVFALESGNTQAILLWDFGLHGDLHLLRSHLFSVPWVSIVNQIVADDLELDRT